MILRRTGRLLLLIVACGAAGAAVGRSAVLPPAPEVEKNPQDSTRLKALIEGAEKAIQAEDWDAAADRADEAETLIADWSEGQLKRPDVAALLERLKAVQSQVEEDTSPAEPDDGLKMTEELVNLAGEDLRSQSEQVKAAEQGAVFDFPIDLNDKVLSWVHALTHEKRGFMEGALSRGTRYLPMARQIFAEEGVPQDLVYLALIESGFKTNAKSRARAVGMWQFIRSTGRLYGLNGNAWVEERRDPVKACRASARYLRRLYETSGDWFLAMVGYNAGPLTTERAIAGLGTRNFWDMARSHYLRNATKNYVPEILAAILVGRFPERYGLDVIQMTPYAYETVEVDKMTSLSVLARFAGTDVEALKDLNPELLRATTPPGHYTLRVPPGTSQDTARALARIPGSQRLDFNSYVIKRGDTLAKVAQRFKVSPEDLLASNNLRKAQFKAGRKIQVPPPSIVPIDNRDLMGQRALPDRPLTDLPTLPPAQPSIEPAPSQSSIPAQAAAPVETSPAGLKPEVAPESAKTLSAARPAFHVVKSGETLFSIAERYGLDLKDLKSWNKIKRNRILVGQKLSLQKR